MTKQPNLFDPGSKDSEIEDVVLYALGDFQSRRKILAGRELPLERLLGAFRRACVFYSVEQYSDMELVEALMKLGASVTEVPDFVAKHPFRITVSSSLADRAKSVYFDTAKSAKKSGGC